MVYCWWDWTGAWKWLITEAGWSCTLLEISSIQLGRLLDLALMVSTVAKSTFFSTLSWGFFQLLPFLADGDLAMVPCALIRLNYNNALYLEVPLRMAQKLQLVPNCAS